MTLAGWCKRTALDIVVVGILVLVGSGIYRELHDDVFKNNPERVLPRWMWWE